LTGTVVRCAQHAVFPERLKSKYRKEKGGEKKKEKKGQSKWKKK